jgi:hypothetical protein
MEGENNATGCVLLAMYGASIWDIHNTSLIIRCSLTSFPDIIDNGNPVKPTAKRAAPAARHGDFQ